MLKLSDFDYTLPKELIAQYPLKERDSCRLMVLDRKDGTIQHHIFKDITDYLYKDDLLVLNDTKVLPGRLIAYRQTGGKAEVLLLERKSGLTFKALLKPNRLKLKERIIFNHGKVQAEITAKNEVKFFAPNIEAIYKLGMLPLPPYIKREVEDLDDIYYQTVYARKDGAVASPTAGLHFTKGLLAKLKSQGINIAYITLHVGYGTFKPVRVEDISRHKMDSEEFSIPAETISKVLKAKKENSRIIAVGTTSLRTLEANSEVFDARGHNRQNARRGSTTLFIYPGYKFKVVDCLLTNFHLPRTSLFMLVCAFAGEKLIKRAYAEAIVKQYRFYSYGDAMLII